jgi:hypothetical protein
MTAARRQLIALVHRRALFRAEVLRGVHARDRVVRARGLLQHARGRFARLDQIRRLGRERAADAALRIGRRGARLGLAVAVVAHQHLGHLAGDSGPNRMRGQRERTVVSSASGSDDTSRKIDAAAALRAS